MKKDRKNIVSEQVKTRCPYASLLNMVVAIILFVLIVIDVSPAYADFDWMEQTAAGSHSWHAITSSSDGTKLAAVTCCMGIPLDQQALKYLVEFIRTGLF